MLPDSNRFSMTAYCSAESAESNVTGVNSTYRKSATNSLRVCQADFACLQIGRWRVGSFIPNLSRSTPMSARMALYASSSAEWIVLKVLQHKGSAFL